MKIKSTWIPFFLSLVAIVSVRVYQITSIGVPSVRMQWDNLEMICFSIAAVATVVIMLMSYLSKDVPEVFVLKKSIPVALVSFLAAAVVALHGVNEIQMNKSASKDIQRLVFGIAAIAAAVALILFGLCFLKEKNLFEKTKLFACIPTFWVVMLLARLFSAYNAIRTDFIHVTHVLSVIGLLFLLFEQARLFVGLFNKGTIKKLFYFGFGSVLFTMTFATNTLAKTLDLGQKIDSSTMLMLATQLVMVLYVVSVIFAVRVGQDAEVVEEISSGTPEKTDVYVAADETVEKVPAEDGPEVEGNTEMAEVDALIADILTEKEATDET